MARTPASVIRHWFSSEDGLSDRLVPRWLFLRGLGLIYFAAFYSLVFQIRGLIGPEGILPAGEYLEAVAQRFGGLRFWYAPTVLWIRSGDHMLTAMCWAGMIAAILLVLNLWPRAMLVICFVCFISFVVAAEDFSGYQSDGMLLEAGFLSLFLVPAGFRPGLGRATPPSRASYFLLQWEWFRIYFGSGVVKLASHDPEWRNFTAMDEYYQNGPLPTWIGWYVQHLPHWFHAFATGATLVLELGLVFMLFLPRPFRIACFLIVTAWQIPVILTANYTFLNYLVLLLGVLLLDDRFSLRVVPEQWKARLKQNLARLSKGEPGPREEPLLELNLASSETTANVNAAASDETPQPQMAATEQPREEVVQRGPTREQPHPWTAFKLAVSSVALLWIFYVTTAVLLWTLFPHLPLPVSPAEAIDPFRIANRYGLFAVMTRGRYEIEFQGSDDGENWKSYPFRYKPQELARKPGLYAPYQPRFDWNLWFASLGSWRENLMVLSTEEHLLEGSRDVLALFAGNPFPNAPPKQVRAVIWQYWFTSMAEKRATGMWWRRELLGLYAPVLARDADGKIVAIEFPQPLTPRQ